LLPPELESLDELPRRPHGGVRVIVAGATSTSGSAATAATLAAALRSAGL